MSARLIVSYVVVFAVSAGLAAASFALGGDERSQPAIAGEYAVACLHRRVQAPAIRSVRRRERRAARRAALPTRAPPRHGDLPRPGGRGLPRALRPVAVVAPRLPAARSAVPAGAPERRRSAEREGAEGRGGLRPADARDRGRDHRRAPAARADGEDRAAARDGRVLAGIRSARRCSARIAPRLQATIFPPDVMPALGVAANLGLVFFMFLVGLEFDTGC